MASSALFQDAVVLRRNLRIEYKRTINDTSCALVENAPERITKVSWSRSIVLNTTPSHSLTKTRAHLIQNGMR